MDRDRLLVTGAGGLLGHAVREIFPGATFVTSRDCDLTEPHETRRLFEAVRPSKVLHLAARVGGVKMNALRNADLFSENVKINTHVLCAARDFGVSRMISVLSSCAFRTVEGKPSTEDDLHAGLPFAGNLGYGYSKRMLDIHTRLLWEQHGSSYSTITPVTMYGPNDNWDLEDGHVIGSLIHRCWVAREEKKDLVVWGSGRAVRQFVFSYDVARILVKELEAFHSPDTLMVAPDHGISIRELADEIAKAMDFSGSIVFDSTKPEGQRVKVIESKSFRYRHAGFQFTSLNEGLRKTVQWFLDHSDAIVGKTTHA